MGRRQGDQVTSQPRSSVTSHTSGCLLVILAARLALASSPLLTPAFCRGPFSIDCDSLPYPPFPLLPYRPFLAALTSRVTEWDDFEKACLTRCR